MAREEPPTSDPFESLPEEIMTSILGLLERWQDMASLSSTSKPNQRLIFTTVDIMLLALLERLPQDHEQITVSANNMSANQMGLAGYFTFKIENGNILIPDQQTQQNIEATMEFQMDFMNPFEEPPDNYMNIGKNVRVLHKYLLAKIPRLNAQQMMGVYPLNHHLEPEIMRLMKLISYESGLTPTATFNYQIDLQGGANKSHLKYQTRIYKVRQDNTGKYILKDKQKLYLKSIKGKFQYIH